MKETSEKLTSSLANIGHFFKYSLEGPSLERFFASLRMTLERKSVYRSTSEPPVCLKSEKLSTRKKESELDRALPGCEIAISMPFKMNPVLFAKGLRF